MLLIRYFSFVPKHEPVSYSDVEQLVNFIEKSTKLIVLTGAGISTESGIPDYRSEGVGIYSRERKKPFKPILHAEFVAAHLVRQRYWLKNFIGWQDFSLRIPNIAHTSLAKLEEMGKIKCVITQNVYNLHHKANSQNVIELHGSAFTVKCLGCNFKISRQDFQNTLHKLNPSTNLSSVSLNPDGDVEIDEDYLRNFYVPSCPNCRNILQPDIVFFGGSVPKGLVNLVKNYVDDCDSLLIIGSTLTVFSSYRIALQAFENKIPIYIINIGKTRADDLGTMKIGARCGEILPLVYEEIVNNS